MIYFDKKKIIEDNLKFVKTFENFHYKYGIEK